MPLTQTASSVLHWRAASTHPVAPWSNSKNKDVIGPKLWCVYEYQTNYTKHQPILTPEMLLLLLSTG